MRSIQVNLSDYKLSAVSPLRASVNNAGPHQQGSFRAGLGAVLSDGQRQSAVVSIPRIGMPKSAEC